MEVLPGSGSVPTPYRFTGQRWDGVIRLYDYNARYYDPAIGRFIQPNYSNPIIHRVPQSTDIGRAVGWAILAIWPMPPPPLWLSAAGAALNPNRGTGPLAEESHREYNEGSRRTGKCPPSQTVWREQGRMGPLSSFR